MDFYESGHSNEEEHKKTDYAIVDDSDAPVDESPHKRVWIYGLADYNGVWYGSEHSNEEEYQTIEFGVENDCDASFDETPRKNHPCLLYMIIMERPCLK